MKQSILLAFSLVSVLFSTPTFATEQNTGTPVKTASSQPEESVPSATQKAAEAVQEKAQEVSAALGETRGRRAAAEYLALASYSPADLLIPGKKGLTLGLIQGAEQTWELEYLRGSLSVPFLIEDLGEMSEERISLIRRSYHGTNSFNLSYGLSYSNFSLHLGNELLSRLSNGSAPMMDLVDIESLGFNVGVGNRWTFKHSITFGIDWISWTQPVLVTKKETAYLDHATNPEDRDDVENAVKFISYFPRLVLFKLQLGIVF